MPTSAARDVLEAILESRAAEKRRGMAAVQGWGSVDTSPAIPAPVVLPFARQVENLAPSRLPPRNEPLPFAEGFRGAVGEGLYGVPVAGPSLLGLGERLQSYATGEPLEGIQTRQEQFRRLYPEISRSAQAAGSMAPMPVLGAGGLGAQVIGNAALAGADAMARGEDPTVTAAVAGGATGALHLPAIFAGPMARTANKEMLKLAEEMAGKGASWADIWKQTGWFKGADDKWRFEISDEAAKLNEPVSMGGSNEVGRLGDKLLHERAYAAYPDLQDIPSQVEMWEGGGGGAYGPAEGMPEALWASGRDPLFLKKTVLHELQHAVQAREGFARGGNPTAMMKDAVEARRIWDDEIVPKANATLEQEDDLYREWLDENRITHGEPRGKAEVDAFRARYAKQFPERAARRKEALDIVSGPKPTSKDLYERLAGEVEARNVSQRANWADKYRRAEPPWMTQDTPTNEQIVRYRTP